MRPYLRKAWNFKISLKEWRKCFYALNSSKITILQAIQALLLIESSTRQIVLQLLDSEHVWSLLKDSLSLLNTPDAPICTTLFELFIVCISRQYEKVGSRVVNTSFYVIFQPDERIEVWQLFHHSSRLQIIDELVRGAARFAEKSAISFHLTRGIRTLSNYQLEAK